MLAATFLAVFFVPVFYVVIQSFSEWRRSPRTSSALVSKPVKEEEIATAGA
jgi:hypothetical protein